MADNFDVVVIGGGPGGYNCAIRLGQLGLSAACVDKRGSFGGTCLNVGCIPSKALLHASDLYQNGANDFPRFGITGTPGIDLPAMMAHKDKVVGELTKGVEFLFKKNKVEGIVGEAKIAAPGKVTVQTKAGTREISAKHIVIATGSDVAPLPRRHHRREADRVVHRRAVAQPRSQAAAGGGRGRDRARAGFGVAAARLRGSGGRIPRPHRAGRGWRSGETIPAPAGTPGHEIQAGEQGRGRGDDGRVAQRCRRTRQGRPREKISRPM